MTPAIPLLEAAREIEDILIEVGLPGIVIGGLAVFRWGEPRTTRDVDFTVLCPFGQERPRVDAICSRVAGRIEDAAQFATENGVLLLRASNGSPVDIALGGMEFEKRAIERGTKFAFIPGISLTTCSAEDLVVMKAFAGRERDMTDIAGIAARQRSSLGWGAIEKELKPLLEMKGDSSTWERLLAIKASTAISPPQAL